MQRGGLSGRSPLSLTLKLVSGWILGSVGKSVNKTRLFQHPAADMEKKNRLLFYFEMSAELFPM